MFETFNKELQLFKINMTTNGQQASLIINNYSVPT